MTELAIAADGLRKSYATRPSSTASTGSPGRNDLLLARPERRGQDHRRQDPVHPHLPRPRQGPIRVGGHDLATEAQALRAAIGVTGQFSAVDSLITGEENMLLMADLHHLSKREGRQVTARLLERFDLTEAAGKPASPTPAA